MEEETESSLLSLIAKTDLDLNDHQAEINILRRQIIDHETEMIGLKLNKDQAKDRLLRLRRRLGVDGAK